MTALGCKLNEPWLCTSPSTLPEMSTSAASMRACTTAPSAMVSLPSQTTSPSTRPSMRRSLAERSVPSMVVCRSRNVASAAGRRSSGVGASGRVARGAAATTSASYGMGLSSFLVLLVSPLRAPMPPSA